MRRIVYYNASRQSVSLLLDAYPNAAAAYSLRYLRSAFVGQPVVRVRRSSDNVEQDFTPTEITDGSLTTFTGDNDGFVTVWYDQSGNLNNYTQITTLNQPKIVSSGVVELENGNPTILFDGTDDFLLMDSKPSTSRLDMYYIYHNTKGNMILNSNGVSRYSEVSQISGSTGLSANYGSPTYRVNSSDIAFTNRTSVYNALSFSQLLQTTNDANISVWSGFEFSKAIFPGFSLGGNVQELIYYDFDQTLNNSGIETNINDHYSIY